MTRECSVSVCLSVRLPPLITRLHSRRRRSGSEPRKTPSNLPRAPDTCRAPRSKSFFGADVRAAVSKAPPAPISDSGRLDEEEEEDDDDDGFGGSGRQGFAASPGLTATMNMWKLEEGLVPEEEGRSRRPQSQAFGGGRGSSLESLRVSVSSRLSDAPDLSPPRRFVFVMCDVMALAQHAVSCVGGVIFCVWCAHTCFVSLHVYNRSNAY